MNSESYTRLLLDQIEAEQNHRVQDVNALYETIERIVGRRWENILLAATIGGVVGGIVGAWVR